MFSECAVGFLLTLFGRDGSSITETMISLDDQGVGRSCVIWDKKHSQFIPCGSAYVGLRYLVSFKTVSQTTFSAKILRVDGTDESRFSLRLYSAANLEESDVLKIGLDDEGNSWEAYINRCPSKKM